MKSLLAILLSLWSHVCFSQFITPVQYLESLPKPNFVNGSLPHLGITGYQPRDDIVIEMATNWYYGLSLGDCTSNVVAGLAIGGSSSSNLISLATNFPNSFALEVNIWRTLDEVTNAIGTIGGTLPPGMYLTNSSGLFVDQNGATTNPAPTVFSPECPDYYWGLLATSQVYYLRIINSNAPIKVILNPGEYGIGVALKAAYPLDPRVQKQSVITNAYDQSTNTSGMSWGHYNSISKSRQLSPLSQQINQFFPSREMYTFYDTPLEQSRYIVPGYGDFENSIALSWWIEYMNTNTDLPAMEDYYVTYNSYTNASGVTKFTVTDHLMKDLDAIGYYLKTGKTNSYNWLMGGYSNTTTNALSSIPRWMGFLKCLYTAGQNGGAILFGLPPLWYQTNNGWIFGTNGFIGSFPANQPPHWLQQAVALSRVHAEFSHLTNWLYGSQLISGPQSHFMSIDQPAYEFTNNAADPTIRVLARKAYGANQWLICAWAAYGPNRNVTVTIPTLGSVTLYARECGTVYTASTTTMTVIDPNGIFPTESNLPDKAGSELFGYSVSDTFVPSPAIVNMSTLRVTGQTTFY